MSTLRIDRVIQQIENACSELETGIREADEDNTRM